MLRLLADENFNGDTCAHCFCANGTSTSFAFKTLASLV